MQHTVAVDRGIPFKEALALLKDADLAQKQKVLAPSGGGKAPRNGFYR